MQPAPLLPHAYYAPDKRFQGKGRNGETGVVAGAETGKRGRRPGPKRGKRGTSSLPLRCGGASFFMSFYDLGALEQMVAAFMI
jgi:hypothetical protein